MHYIKKAVQELTGCDALRVDTQVVTEKFRGQVLWEGFVEVFDLKHHAVAKRAYGWSTGTGENARYFAILETAPITAPKLAIKAAIYMEAWNTPGLRQAAGGFAAGSGPLEKTTLQYLTP